MKEFTEDEIKEDDQFLRAYASRLGSSLFEAEDIAQEVWKEILETHPRRGPGFRRWLCLAARHAALREVRRNRSRTRREASFHEQRTAEPAALIAASRSLRAWVVNLVEGLPAPYREVVRMRFLEEMSSVDIGRRLGRSDSLVRVQIQRGLKQLHTRVKRRESPLSSVLFLPCILRDLRRRLIPGRLQAAGASFGLACLAMVPVLWPMITDGREGSEPVPRHGETAAWNEVYQDRDAGSLAVSSRSVLPPIPRFPGRLHLEFLERDGTPIGEMPVLLRQRQAESSRAPALLRSGRTTVTGELVFEQAAGRWEIQALRGATRQVDVPADRMVRMTIHVREGVLVQAGVDTGKAGMLWVSYPDDPDMGRFTSRTTATGFPSLVIDPSSWIGIRQHDRAMSRLVRVDTLAVDSDGLRTVHIPASRAAGRLDGVVLDHRGEPVRDAWVRVACREFQNPTYSRSGELWRASTSSSLTDENGEFELHKGTDQFSRVLVSTGELRYFETRSEQGRCLKEDLVIRLPRPMTLRGTVWTVEGLPAARASVTCRLGEWSTPFTVRASDAGEFEIQGLATGPVQLVAEAEDGSGSCSVRRDVSESSLFSDLELLSDRAIIGRVLSASGESLADVHVHLEAQALQAGRLARQPVAREDPTASTVTDKNGCFRLGGLEPEGHTLRVVSRNGGPIWSIEGVYPGPGETIIRAGITGAVAGRLENPRGPSISRLFLDSTLLQEVCAVELDRETGWYESRGLQPGSYRLLAEVAGAGCALLCDVLIAPGVRRELGVLQLEEPGSLGIDIPDHLPASPGEIASVTLTHEDGPWPRMERFASAPGGYLEIEHLFPGNYRIEVDYPHMLTWSRRLTIEAGMRSSIVPEYRPGSMVRIRLPRGFADHGSTGVRLEVDGVEHMSGTTDLSHTSMIYTTLAFGPHRLRLEIGNFWQSEFDVQIPEPAALAWR